MVSTSRRRTTLVALLAGISIVFVVAGLCLGEPALSPFRAAGAVFGGDDSTARVLITQVRAPRAALAVVVGAALAISGLLLQDVLRNGLASPELLGTSSGAALAMALVTLTALPVPFAAHPFVALGGAVLGGLLVLGCIGRTWSPQALIVIGASVSAMLAAVLVAAIGIGGGSGRLNLLMTYLLGTLANRTWGYLLIAGVPLLLALAVLRPLARRVEVVGLGDTVASGLGVSVARTRVTVIVVTACVVAGVTAACGPIAFVALLAPHLARRILRENRTGVLVVPAALLGVTLLLGADLLARRIMYPVELPVGVMTTILGVPVLLWLLMRRNAQERLA